MSYSGPWLTCPRCHWNVDPVQCCICQCSRTDLLFPAPWLSSPAGNKQKYKSLLWGYDNARACVKIYSSTFPWELEPGLSGLNQQPQGHLVALTSLATYNHRHGEQASAHSQNVVTQGSQEGAAYPNITKTWDLATLTPFVARKYSKPTGGGGGGEARVTGQKSRNSKLHVKGEEPPRRVLEWRFENRSLFLNVCMLVRCRARVKGLSITILA